MTLLAPLRGLRPRPDRASEIAELPYDVMSRDEARDMASGRPNSFLHVSRPDIDLADSVPADGPVARASARAAFERLRRDGLMLRDSSPAFHVYRMTVGGHVQTGVVGVADVAAYESGRIRRHETTRPDKQADRTAHIEALDAQTGPVLLVHQPDPRIESVLASVTDAGPAPTRVVGHAGVLHELWPITDPAAVASLEGNFEEQRALYIADGHHRSAAAAEVHARRGTEASGGFLAVSFPADQMQVLAYNRIVRAEPGVGPADLLAQVGRRARVEPSPAPVAPVARGDVGMYLDGKWYRLTFPDEARATGTPADRLDVAVLQRLVLAPVLGIDDPRRDPRIGFVGGIRPLAELAGIVDSGWTAAFSMHATTVGELIAVADAGLIMPPKSTWFEPKLLDGLVVHVLD